jgi:hypothetical protein
MTKPLDDVTPAMREMFEQHVYLREPTDDPPYVDGCYRCELNKDEVPTIHDLAADILEFEAWFNGLAPEMKDALSRPNHEMQQAERAVELARAVLATPDRAGAEPLNGSRTAEPTA